MFLVGRTMVSRSNTPRQSNYRVLVDGLLGNEGQILRRRCRGNRHLNFYVRTAASRLQCRIPRPPSIKHPSSRRSLLVYTAEHMKNTMPTLKVHAEEDLVDDHTLNPHPSLQPFGMRRPWRSIRQRLGGTMRSHSGVRASSDADTVVVLATPGLVSGNAMTLHLRLRLGRKA